MCCNVILLFKEFELINVIITIDKVIKAACAEGGALTECDL